MKNETKLAKYSREELVAWIEMLLEENETLRNTIFESEQVDVLVKMRMLAADMKRYSPKPQVIIRKNNVKDNE